MNTAEMQAAAREMIADMLRDGEEGRLPPMLYAAVVDGLRERGVAHLPACPPNDEEKRNG